MHQLPRTQSTRTDGAARLSNTNRTPNLRDNSSAQIAMPTDPAAMERMGAEVADVGQSPEERQNLQNRNASKLNQIIQV